MKRLFGTMLLLLAILLCSCNRTSPQETGASDALDASGASETTALEDAIAEKALRRIQLDNTFAEIVPMGADLLLFGQEELTVLDGQTMEPVTTAKVTGLPNPDSGRIQVHADGVAYFDAASKDMVFLASALEDGSISITTELFSEPATFYLEKVEELQ